MLRPVHASDLHHVEVHAKGQRNPPGQVKSLVQKHPPASKRAYAAWITPTQDYAPSFQCTRRTVTRPTTDGPAAAENKTE